MVKLFINQLSDSELGHHGFLSRSPGWCLADRGCCWCHVQGAGFQAVLPWCSWCYWEETMKTIRKNGSNMFQTNDWNASNYTMFLCVWFRKHWGMLCIFDDVYRRGWCQQSGILFNLAEIFTIHRICCTNEMLLNILTCHSPIPGFWVLCQILVG